MPLKFIQSHIEDCIEITCDQFINTQNAEVICQRIQQLNTSKSKKLLLNQAMITVPEYISTISDFYVAERMQMYFNKIEKIALLYPKQSDEDAYFEVYCNNRGINLKFFYDREKAEAWLK